MSNQEQQYFWLEEAFQRIKKSYDADKLPHGLLVVAPDQSGKKRFAINLARSILCRASAQQLNKACGQCKSCLLVQAESHPDLSQIDCLTDNKGKLKKSIGIDQIRQLTNKLVETSQLNGWRIAIVMSVEKMTRGAFNAILKTLEEPGDKTLVLMLASSLQQVPATIKSRCQLLRLKLVDQQLSCWLMEAAECSESEALNALNQCQFAPFAALNFIKEGTAQLYMLLNQSLDAILTTQLTPTEFLSEYSELEELLWLQIAKYFQNVQLSILNSNKGIYSKVPATLANQLYFELVEYNRAQCAGSNLQSSLQLEAILIQWFELGRKIVHYSAR
jgi:DNA polymerase-3 subunit delta'